MGLLRDRMMHDLELAGYVPKTRLIYLNSIRDYAKRFGRSPADLGADEVRVWVDDLTKESEACFSKSLALDKDFPTTAGTVTVSAPFDTFNSSPMPARTSVSSGTL